MPILRTWELHGLQERSQWLRTLLFPVLGGVPFAVISLVCARALGAPSNPGSLAARLLTTPFAAVITEIVAHLLILSVLALWLKKRWLAILLSSVAFTVMFHGQSVGSLSVTVFALGVNFLFSAFTGWTYTRHGFLSAILLHAVAHAIVLGVN